MQQQTNTPPTYDEANAAPLATPSAHPHLGDSNSISQLVPSSYGQTWNRNSNYNNNLPAVDGSIAPPPYTPEQPPNNIPPSLYDDDLSDVKEMIVIMGMRGGGKSYFINKMVGGDVATIGNGTSTCQTVPAQLGRSKVILIDTPGFDKFHLSEALVCAEISRVLAQLYQRGVSLRGFIYIQSITEKKTIGNAASVLRMFRSLCGDTNLLKNTILVTTGWQLQQVDESQGAAQERKLRKFWGQMLHQGSTMVRYYGDRGSGVGIVSRILGNKDIPFETKEELIARGKQLEQRAIIATEVARLQQELDDVSLS